MIEEFPLLEKTTYLNTAYVGLMSKRLMHHRHQSDIEYLHSGDHYKLQQETILEECHQTIADFIGTSPQQTFFIANFSTGIRLALQCIPKTHHFLILEEDYPSLTTAIEENGFTTTTIPITSSLEEDISATMALHKIDVLALSIVQYTSGLLIDFKALHQLKVNYPNLLIIADGTQFIGGLPFHFDSAPFDLVVGSGYKWLLAGFGSGLLAVSSNFLMQTNTTVEMIYNKIFAGHFNILGATSLTFALQLLDEWDFPQLLQKKEMLNNQLRKALNRLELMDPLIKDRTAHSSIYKIQGDQERYDALLSHKIRCKQRSNGIRISLHFYNSEEDIEKLVAFLENDKRF